MSLLNRKKIARSKTGKGRRSKARIGRREKAHSEVSQEKYMLIDPLRG